jgi:hypothetical protein
MLVTARASFLSFVAVQFAVVAAVLLIQLYLAGAILLEALHCFSRRLKLLILERDCRFQMAI